MVASAGRTFSGQWGGSSNFGSPVRGRKGMAERKGKKTFLTACPQVCFGHLQGQGLLAYSSSPVPVTEAAFTSLPLLSPGSSTSRALCRGDAVRYPLSMCLFSTREMRRIRGKSYSPSSGGVQSKVQVVFIRAAALDETEDPCSTGS